jgi:hypothetical protein
MRPLAFVGVLVLALAACGGGGRNTDVDRTKHDWTTFFSAKAPQARRVAMLQGGARFKSTVTRLENDPLYTELSAKVSSVTLERAKKAKVVYSIYFGKVDAFSNQVGYAYKQKGKWLVGHTAPCNLIGPPTPAGCLP